MPLFLSTASSYGAEVDQLTWKGHFLTLSSFSVSREPLAPSEVASIGGFGLDAGRDPASEKHDIGPRNEYIKVVQGIQ